MNIDACPKTDVIQRFALGWLPREESLALEEHLVDCPFCSPRLQATEAVGDPLLEAIRARPQAPTPLPEVVAALLPILRALAPPEETISGASPPPGQDAAEVDAPALPLGFLDPPLTPGDLGVLGGYRVKRFLGAGGMGIVMLAEDPRLRRPLAIKVIQPHLAPNADIRERFLREARVVAALEHDNIVAVHRADEHNGMLYLAMPLLRGASLETRLIQAKGPLPLREVLQIGRETAAGLAAAHACCILHRDVKPGNIWLEDRPEAGPGAFRVKLLDFGLAHQTGTTQDERNQKECIVGTPAYMAPEQARSAKIDDRADLFSLGCLLYRIASGRLPFSGDDTLAVLVSVASDHPPPPEGTPPDLSRLIMQLLAKKPKDRPASARVVVEIIQRIERKRFGPRLTRRRWLIASGLGGAALAGGLVWRFAGPPPAKPAPPGEVSFVLEEPDSRIVLTPDDGEERTVDLAKESTLELPAGAYTLRTVRKEERRTLVPERWTVKAGEKQRVTLRLVGELRQQAEHTLAVWAVALSPVKDSLMALSGSSDQTVAVWDAAKDGQAAFLKGHNAPVRCVAMSADGRLGVSGSGAPARRPGLRPNCSVRVWDLKQGREIECPVDHHDYWIACVAMSPKELLIGWGASDGVASLWDRQRGKKRTDLIGHDAKGVNSIAFSPDGKRVLTGGGDGLVLLWDAVTGKQQRKLSGHERPVRSVAFSPTENRAVSAGEDGTIRVWDLEGNGCGLLKGHKEAVYSVSWTPDGRRLVSGGGDGTVRIWSAAERSEIYCLKGHAGPVHAVACAGDGRRALSGGADRTVRLWELPE